MTVYYMPRVIDIFFFSRHPGFVTGAYGSQSGSPDSDDESKSCRQGCRHKLLVDRIVGNIVIELAETDQ